VKVVRLFGSALAKFDRDQCFFLASGIAFQLLLCLVPFMLLVLSFAGSYLLTHERAVDQVRRYLEQAAPALDPTVQKNIIGIVSHRGTTGVIGTVGLVWLASTVFSWLRIALNTIFDVPKARGTFRGLVFDLGMMVLCGGLFLFSVGLTAVVEYLRRHSSPLFPALTGQRFGITLTYVVPFLVVLAVCFLIYHLVPNRRVSTRAALFGAVFSGVLWEAAKHLFTWYVSAFESYSLLYGSLSAAAVLLLGAEVTVLLEQELARRPGAEPPRDVVPGAPRR
jgi:membrane protein